MNLQKRRNYGNRKTRNWENLALRNPDWQNPGLQSREFAEVEKPWKPENLALQNHEFAEIAKPRKL